MATGRVLGDEVVPGAGQAHLDVEAEHRLHPAAEAVELGRGAWAPATRGQAGAEHVGHLDHLPFPADRAVLTSRASDVAGRPEELGVGVADLDRLHLAPADPADHRVPDQPVLDPGTGRGRDSSIRRSRPGGDGHAPRLAPARPAHRPHRSSGPVVVVDISIRYIGRVLEMAILGLLEDQDLHGYEIRRQLRTGVGLLADVSWGSIYPALRRLETAGAVEASAGPDGATGSRRPRPPATGSLSGEWAALRSRRGAAPRGRRGRKVYRITDAGRRTFGELVDAVTTNEDDRTFGLRLALARHLAPGRRLVLLQRRRAEVLARLEEVREVLAGSGLDRYARSVVEHGLETAEHDLAWLDRLIAAEPGPMAEPTPAARSAVEERSTREERNTR